MSYKIIGKYIKKLNFSIPNPKTFFLLSKDIAKYKLILILKAPIWPPIFIIKNISKAGKPIKNRKNVFICLIQNYIIHVYL